MSRAERRRELSQQRKQGTVELFDPQVKFRVKYDINVPGGPLRDSNPAQFSGQIVADSEADITRGMIVKLINAFGYERVGRAVAGMFCEVINPMSTTLRSLIAIGIAQGSGLKIAVQDITSCVDCGAEREVYSILDPNAEDEAAVSEDDQTRHADECPTQNKTTPTEDEPALVLERGKTVEWRTAPAIVIDYPSRYRALGTAPSAAAQDAAIEIAAQETTEEIAEEKLDRPISDALAEIVMHEEESRDAGAGQAG